MAMTRPEGSRAAPDGPQCSGRIVSGWGRRGRSSGLSIPVQPRCPTLPPAIPDFNPAIDGIYERAMSEKMRDDLLNALVKPELCEQDVQRLEQRNAYLEGELRLQAQHHTNRLKELITLRRQLAEPRPKKRR